MKSDDNRLTDVLKQLHRGPLSQTELAQRMGLSKSHISFLVNNLLGQGLIIRLPDFLPEKDSQAVRRTHKLKLLEDCYDAILAIHHQREFSLNLITYANPRVLNKVVLDNPSELDAMLPLLRDGIKSLTRGRRAKTMLLCFATQATLEQGDTGLVYRDNVLNIASCPLAQILTRETGLKSYVYNYAYGHLLSLLHGPYIDIDNALALSCGEGSVALGLYLDGKIVLGSKNSFPECSHLPYPRGFEQSLGEYGPHTADALAFAVSCLAPIFNFSRVIVTGSCFKDHLDAVVAAQAALKASANPMLGKIRLEYRENEIAGFMNEFACLCFDHLAELLNPQIIRGDIRTLLKRTEA